MAFSYTQKYRYNGLLVEVVKMVSVSENMSKFQCLVRGYGPTLQKPRKKYTVEAETNAKASRIALQMYKDEYGQNKE